MALTLQSLQDHLGVWIPQVQGQYINEDWNPENQGFGAQCWDLAANWSKFLGLPVINTGYPGRWSGWAGNMVSAYPQTAEIAAAYELVSPDQPGLAGDIAVWGDSYKEYYPATHVAVLIRDANLQLLCASQNSTSSRADNPYPKWSSGPATIQYLPRRGLIGFLRPRVGGINYQSITIEEDPLATFTFDDLKRAATEGALDALKFPFPNETGGKTSVEGMLSVFDKQRYEIISQTAEATARLILNTSIARGGGSVGGETSLAGVVAYFDQNRADILNAVGGKSGDVPGLNPDQVNAAIKAGLDAALAGTSATITLGGKSNG